MRILSTNVAMMSPIGMGRQGYLTSDTWNAIIQTNSDIMCLNEVRPGSNRSLWAEQLEKFHDTSFNIQIPSNSAYVALCVKNNPNIQVELREDVPQYDRAATWWIHTGLNTDNPPNKRSHTLEKFSLTIVYAPADGQLRRRWFKEELCDVLNSLYFTSEEDPDMSTACLLTGDFNDFPSALDFYNERNVPGDRSWSEALGPKLLYTGFYDTYRERNPDSPQFSFKYKRQEQVLSETRIDNTLINSAMETFLTEIEYSDGPISTSIDHSAITMKLNIEFTRKKLHGNWKLHKSLLSSTTYLNEMDKFLVKFDQLHSRKSCINYIRILMREVKRHSIEFLARTREGYRQQVLTFGYQNISRELAESIQREDRGDYSSTVISRYAESYRLDSERIEQQRRRRLQAEDRNPTAFTREAILKQKGRELRIKKLEDPDGIEPISEVQSVMRDRTVKFYQRLMTPDLVEYDISFDYEASEFLKNCLNADGSRVTIPSSDRKRLLKDITQEEITTAGKRCNKNSANGESGLPYKFWTTFNNILGKRIAGVANELMNGATLPVGEPTILVKLLHKKGTRVSLRNYRPISLVETYYRLNDIAISTKLGPILAKVIPDTQTAFIPGRNIIMNVLLIFMVLEAYRMGLLKNPEAMMLSLDQEKAYDRVNQLWLWSVFRFYNIPDRLRNLFQNFYRHASSKYDINGVYTTLICLDCGLLQGAPISTLLYIIVLQPFLNYIENRKLGITISSPKFGTAKVNQIAFADDVWVFIRNSGSYQIFEQICHQFSRLSNSKFNLAKTRMHEFSGASNWTTRLRNKYLLLPPEFIVLGIPIRIDGQLPRETLQVALSKMSNSVTYNHYSEYSLLGRINVVNTFLTSKMWYVLQIGPIANWILKDMKTFMTKYIFFSKKGWVDFRITCLPKHMGGLNLLSPEAMTYAMEGLWISYAFANQGLSARLFKIVYAEAVYRATGKPPIYCILYPSASKQKKLELARPLSPFFNRVANTLFKLNCSLRLQLSNYNSDQALSLPWKHDLLYKKYPVIGARALGHSTATMTGVDTHAIYAGEFTGWTYRDILFWNIDTQTMIAPDKVMVDYILQCDRFDHFRNNPSKVKSFRSSWQFVGAHIDYYIKERLPQEFRHLLLCNIRPICCNTVRKVGSSYLFEFADYKNFDIQTMIPWHDISLADRPMKDYQVKSARVYAQTRNKPKGYVHVPNHNVKFPNKKVELAVWAGQWNELHSLFRTPEHTSIYYLVLQNRARLAKDYTVGDALWTQFTLSFDTTNEEYNDADNDTDDEVEDPDYDPDQLTEDLQTETKRLSYKTIMCCCCSLQKDSVEHSYATCVKVQSFWLACARELLTKAIGVDDSRYKTMIDQTRKVTLRDVLFCFPIWKKESKRYSVNWHRLLLWHSCCIVTIHKIRQMAFNKASYEKSRPKYDIANSEATMMCKKEYRICLTDIYSEKLRLDLSDPLKGPVSRVDQFKKNYIEGSSLARPTTNGFTFIY